MHKTLNVTSLYKSLSENVSSSFCTTCMIVHCVLLLRDDIEPYAFSVCWLETYIFSFHCNIHPYYQLSNQNYYYTAYILKKWVEKIIICSYPEFGKQIKQALYDLKSWWCDLKCPFQLLAHSCSHIEILK